MVGGDTNKNGTKTPIHGLFLSPCDALCFMISSLKWLTPVVLAPHKKDTLILIIYAKMRI